VGETNTQNHQQQVHQCLLLCLSSPYPLPSPSSFIRPPESAVVNRPARLKKEKRKGERTTTKRIVVSDPNAKVPTHRRSLPFPTLCQLNYSQQVCFSRPLLQGGKKRGRQAERKKENISEPASRFGSPRFIFRPLPSRRDRTTLPSFFLHAVSVSFTVSSSFRPTVALPFFRSPAPGGLLPDCKQKNASTPEEHPHMNEKIHRRRGKPTEARRSHSLTHYGRLGRIEGDPARHAARRRNPKRTLGPAPGEGGRER